MSDQRRDLHQMEDLLDQARKDWVEAERQRLLSLSIEYTASICRGLSKAKQTLDKEESKLYTSIYATVFEELAKNAEYVFNIPKEEFKKKAKEKAKK